MTGRSLLVTSESLSACSSSKTVLSVSSTADRYPDNAALTWRDRTDVSLLSLLLVVVVMVTEVDGGRD